MSGGKADVAKSSHMMEVITGVRLVGIHGKRARDSPAKMVKLGFKKIEAADRDMVRTYLTQSNHFR
jgi:hypothetical protein